MAVNSLNFFKVDVFNAEGFIDSSVNRWERRKNGDSTRRMLVKTGRMRQSGKVAFVTPIKARIEFTAPYSSFHNKGSKHLPKRQFVGHSKKLNEQNEKILLNYVNTILK